MSKRALITGCSSGIGHAACIELTRRGYEVVATARSLAEIAKLPVAQKLALDVTSQASVDEAFARAGRLDVVVNNAGVGLWAPVEAAPMEDVKRLFETNVFGPLRVIQAALPQMRARQDGIVIQVSSAAGQVAGPLVGHYAASKHALEAYSEALRLEVAPFGVKVAIMVLGAVESDFPKNRIVVRAQDYEQVVAGFTAGLMHMRGVTTSAEKVAEEMAAIIADGARSLRYWCTPDAKPLVDARRGRSDAENEALLLAGAGLAPPAS